MLDAEIDMSNAASSESESASKCAITKDGNEEKGHERKKGHKMFFVCCDTKRAVISLNTIMLMVNVFTLTAAIVGTDHVKTEGYARAVVMRSCGMLVTFTTILGAYWYSKSLVTVGLLFTCYLLTVAIVEAARYNSNSGYNEDELLKVLVPTIWYSLVFYAEGTFISEVADGIMSAETYKRRERYSCCCNC
mmetsp:Transcript_54041/g.114773  ORF Transcript_54041/g.114773 Transcript_54041/m.114773 type:complete len:191 (-) Transcript_54041:162-734(-)